MSRWTRRCEHLVASDSLPYGPGRKWQEQFKIFNCLGLVSKAGTTADAGLVLRSYENEVISMKVFAIALEHKFM